MSFSFIVFNFLLCRFETMVDMLDVQAQFNGGEPLMTLGYIALLL